MRNIMLQDARYGYGISLAMTGITEIPISDAAETASKYKARIIPVWP